MRSVLVHLATPIPTVEAFLGRMYPFQPPPPWIEVVDGDSCLYINVVSDYSTWVPEELAPVFAHFAPATPITVVADVSGRHDGTSQALHFVELLLGEFGGVAEDGYSDHLWTLDEIREGVQVEGHAFFDFKGRSTVR